MKKICCLYFLIPLMFACSKTEQLPLAEVETPTTPLYFPPINQDNWESIAPVDLGWKTAQIPALLNFLEENNTRAFLLIKDGKIVVEAYFNKDLLNKTFTKESNWYWASAGKSLTGFLVGQAQEDGHLRLSDKTSDYLGQGWTSLSTEQEQKITVQHQLSMMTGLDDGVANSDCTDPICLKYLEEAGTRWAYHNAPYTLLDKVIEKATKQSFDTYFNNQLRNPIGMDGIWRDLDYNHVYFSTARSMARFGLLILNKGTWENELIIKDKDYFAAMVNTSQSYNLSYGYLWWLNGKDSSMVPGLQTVFKRSLTPNAPVDMVAAMGKNGQLINIVPSENLVMVRMGDSPDNALVPINFQDELWQKINELIK